ncbi:MAG: CPBP family intramembrane metalloprotease [Oscillospiraceae bacterium]|nr:CPBP family intramembrane metalloprotease [Oscillospiraceae bacterium]
MNELRGARAAYSRAGAALFVSGVLLVLTQYLGSFLTLRFAPSLNDYEWYPYLLLLAAYAAAALSLRALLGAKRDTESGESGGFSLKLCASALPVCMFLSYVLSLAGQALDAALSSLAGREYQNPVQQAVEGESALAILLVMVIIAPVIEEYMFRRLLLDALKPYSKAQAAISSALAFALFHFNLSQFFYAFAAGLALALLALKTNSIVTGTVLHMLINFFGALAVPALVSASSTALNNIGLWLMAGFSAAGAYLIIAKRKKLLDFWRSLDGLLSLREKYLNGGFFAFFALCLFMFVLSVFE